MKEIITIKEYSKFEETILGSKFITRIWNIENEEDAKNKIQYINQKYSDATHNCYAYVLDTIERFSDDGEPQKTAGYPILEAIKYANLKYVLIIVTRYFGGTLLGTGGLIRAYGSGAKNVIDISEKCYYTKGKLVKINISYSNLDKFKNFCINNNLNIVNEDFLENVIVYLEIPIDYEEKLKEFLENLLLDKIENIINTKIYTVIEEKNIKI